jgi:hypothetical protein
MTEVAGLPPRTHPNWNAVAVGKIKRPWSALGMKIMMTRIAMEMAKDGSPAAVQKFGDEIYDFFKKNEKIAAQDLRAIFS